VRIFLVFRLALLLALIAALLAACSRDPNVRRRNFSPVVKAIYEKGEVWPRPPIEFRNAIAVDPSLCGLLNYQLAIDLHQESTVAASKPGTCALPSTSNPKTTGPRSKWPKLFDCPWRFSRGARTSGHAAARPPEGTLIPLLSMQICSPAQASFPAAIQEIQKAIALDPSAWDSYLNLALMQLRKQSSGGGGG